MAALLTFDRDAAAAFPQTCSICQKDTDEARQKRKRWGCDEELSDSEWARSAAEGDALEFEPCYRCHGKDPDCQVCEGSNTWKLLRCPYACVEQWHFDVCTAVDLLQVGVTAFAGGWFEQPALLVRASQIAMAERNRIDKARRKRDQDRARRDR